METTKEEILKMALEVVTKSFDDFILVCMDKDGKPKAPHYRDLAKARGCMPEWCESSYQKEKKNKEKANG